MLLRVVDSGIVDPGRSVAVDEAMLMARHLRIAPNSLHLYVRDRPTVSLGYFEKEEEAVDLAVAKARNVAIVRRASGGSAIYTDPGQLIYALVIDDEARPGEPRGDVQAHLRRHRQGPRQPRPEGRFQAG